MRSPLKMKPPQNAGMPGEDVIILHKIEIDAVCFQRIKAERFRKIATTIRMLARGDQQEVADWQGFNLNGNLQAFSDVSARSRTYFA